MLHQRVLIAGVGQHARQRGRAFVRLATVVAAVSPMRLALLSCSTSLGFVLARQAWRGSGGRRAASKDAMQSTEDRRKAVFLVRHGQSEWNLAAKQLDLWTLLSKVDHVLTPEGVNQAKRLRSAVEAANVAGDMDAHAFAAPTTQVFSSPLTRALSTALVTFSTGRPITLLPDARELAWPLAGPDSVGAAVGSGIAERALDALAALDTRFQNASPDRIAAAAAINASAAQDKWWPGFRESKKSMQERLQRLLRSQLSQPCVLVCHSLLIRCLFVDFASPALESQQNDLLSQLRSRKLENCGVVRVELDNQGRLASAKLVFGSKLV